MRDKNEILPVEGAKAGSKQKQPYRAAVTSTTNQKMRITYGLSEGEIAGFNALGNFTESDMLKRIFLDGTPIMSPEGDKLLDVKVEFRSGTQDQNVINGLPSVTVENSVNVEVKLNAPVSRSFTRVETTSFDIRVSVPQLWDGDEEGNSRKGTIQFRIEVSVNNGPFNVAGTFTINEKILSGWSQTYNVAATKGSSHTIRIVRVTSEQVNEFSANKLIVDSIVEVTDVRLRYPRTALLYLEYNADQFSNIPKLEVQIFGKADILVPANYNTITRVYATTGIGTSGGVWDGTFKRAYTDNPVWVWLDLVTSKRYGTGNRININMVDKWELYGLAKYCDQLVSDGKGGQEPRFTCNNLYLQKSEDAFKVLKDLTAMFRSKTVWDGSKIRPVADVPRTPALAFTSSNCKDIVYSSVDTSAQHNLVNVQYYDKANRFASKIEMRRDAQNIVARNRVVEMNFTALGCTSAGQAQRIAQYILVSEINEQNIVSFTTGLEGSIPRLNDVFYFADEYVAGRVIGGRVKNIVGTQVYLDREVPLPAGSATGSIVQIILNRDDATTAPIRVMSVAADKKSVFLQSVPPASTGPELQWALITPQVVPQMFYITDLEYNDKDKTYNISGMQYLESKYAAIDGDARIVLPPISIIENKMLLAPASITATYIVKIIQDISVCNVDVSWAQSKNAIKYQLEFRKDGGEWRIVGIFTSLTATLENMYSGIYEFRIAAYDMLNNASQYAYSAPLNVAGKVLPPPVLSSYAVQGILLGFQHNWAFPAHTEDSRAVRIRRALQDPAVVTGQNYEIIDVAYPANQFTQNNVPSNTTAWFSAAIVDKYGSIGPYTSWRMAKVNDDPDQIMDLIEGHIGLTELDQELSSKIVSTEQLATIAKNEADQAKSDAAAAQIRADAAKAQADQARVDAAAAAGTANSAVVAAASAQTTADGAKSTAESALTKSNQNAINLTNETNARIANDTAEANARIAAIATLQDGMTTETQQRKDADSAMTTLINTNKSSTDSAIAAVQTQVTSHTTTLSAHASQLSTLDSRLTTNETATAAAQSLAASAKTQAQTAVDLGTVNASNITTLRADLSTGKGKNAIIAPFSDPQSISPYVIGANRTVALVASTMRIKGKAYEVTFTTATGNVYFGTTSVATPNTTAAATVRGGKKYMLSAYLKNIDPAKLSDVYFTIYWFRRAANGTVTTGAVNVNNQLTSNIRFTPTNDGSVHTSRSYQAPDDAFAATIQMSSNGTFGVAGSKVIVDMLMLEESIGDDKPASMWVAGAPDLGAIQDSLDASASAITSLTSQVSTLNGTVTSQGSAITALNNSVTTINQTLSTKADAAALTALTTRVTTAEGNITSQSQQLTTLSNSITTINNTLATKADAAALTTLTNRVTSAEGTISSQSTQLTSLQNSVTTINQSLATKAEAAALTVLENRVTSTETGLTSQSTQITTLNNNLTATNNVIADVDTLARLTTLGKPLRDDPTFLTTTGGLAFYTPTSGTTFTRQAKSADNPSGSTNEMLLRYTAATTGSGWYPNSPTLTFGANKVIFIKQVIKIPVGYRLMAVGNSTGTGGYWKIYGDVNGTGKYATYYSVVVGGPDATATVQGHFRVVPNTGATVGTPENPVDVILASYEAWDVTAVNDTIPKSFRDAITANSSALTTLNSTVTQHGNTITSLSSSVTTLQNDITTINGTLATKASAQAVTNLETRVTNVEGVNTSQGTAITTLQNDIVTINGSLATKASAQAVSLLDTRVTATENSIISTSNSITKLSNHVDSYINSESLLPDYDMANPDEWEGSGGVAIPAGRFVSLTGGRTGPTMFAVGVGQTQPMVYNKTTLPNDRAYKVTFWARVSAEGTGKDYIGILRGKPDGTWPWGEIALQEIAAGTIPRNATWTKVTQIIDQRANAVAYPKIRLGFSLNTNQSAGYYHLQAFKVEVLTNAADVDGTVATADALQSLSNTVTTLNGTVSSQGTAITNLQNNLVTINNTLAAKADSSAVTTLTSRVTAAEGNITSNSQAITSLQNSITTINGSLASKADASALTTLAGRVTTAEGTITAHTSQITSLNVSLRNTVNGMVQSAAIGAIPDDEWLYTSSSGERTIVAETTALGGQVYRFGNNAGNDHVNAHSKTKIAFDPNKTYRIRARYRRVTGTGTVYLKIHTLAADGVSQVNAANQVSGGGSSNYFVINAAPALNVWQEITVYIRGRAAGGGSGSWTLDAPYMLPNLTAYMAVGILANYSAAAGQVDLDFISIEDGDAVAANAATASALTTLSADVTSLNGTVTSQGTSITNLQNSVTSINGTLSSKADASALTSLSNRVTTAEGTISSHTSQITNLQNSVTSINGTLANKADASALTSLANRVTTAEGTISTHTSQITSLNNSITTINGSLATKAEAAALNTLTNRVDAHDGTLTSLSQAVTSLNSSVSNSASIISMSGGAAESEWEFSRPALTTGEYSTIVEATGKNGRVIQLGNGTTPDVVWMHPNNFMQFDETKSYRLKVRFRRKSGTASVYVGIAQKNADKTAYITTTNTTSANMGSSNYLLSGSSPALGVWQELTYVIKGRSTGAAGGSGTAASPRTVSKAATFITPMFIANYGGNAGVTELDYIVLEDAEALDLGTANAAATTLLEARTTAVEGTVSSQASQITTLTTTVGNHTTSISTNATSIDGINAKYTVKIDNNGYIAGYGLISTMNNGVPTSAFTVNADFFSIGKVGSGSTTYRPFVVVTSANQVIEGDTYPEVGVYMRQTFIAKASIGTAHIKDLSVTTGKIANLAVDNAKIANLAVTNGKIANLSVDTLKIQDNAVTVPLYFADYSTPSSSHLPIGTYGETLAEIQLIGISQGQNVVAFVNAIPALNSTNMQVGAVSSDIYGTLELAIFQGGTKIRTIQTAAMTTETHMVWQSGGEGGGGGYYPEEVQVPAKIYLSPQATSVMFTAESTNPILTIRVIAAERTGTIIKLGGAAWTALGVKK